MKRTLITGLLLAALAAPAYANQCNPQLDTDFRTQCDAAAEVKDYSEMAVYCKAAGKETGICANEFTGSSRVLGLNVKLVLFAESSQGYYNIQDFTMTQTMNDIIIRDAAIVLSLPGNHDVAAHTLKLAKDLNGWLDRHNR